MRANQAGKDLIKRWEGCQLTAYRCPANVLTIGYGHTGDVKEGQKITQHQADTLFDYDIEKYEDGVTRLGVILNANEFSALVSFAYNLGISALSNSGLLRKIRGGDKPGAAKEFGRWVMAGGKKLPGLVARREAERVLFLTVPA